MRLRDEYGHFKSVEKVRLWAHKINFKTWTSPRSYDESIFETYYDYPRIFTIIKRKTV